MLPLDLFRYSTRLKALTIAVGICVAFIIGSFAFTNGLNLTVKNITTKFQSEGAIVYDGDTISSSLIDISKVNFDRNFITVGLCTASIGHDTRTFFAVKDPNSLLHQDLQPPPGSMFNGRMYPLNGTLLIANSEGAFNVSVNHTFSSSMFPTYWHLLNWEDIIKLKPELANNASFVIFTSIDDALRSQIRSQGLNYQEMTGILNYFSGGAEEVTNDLWLIIIPASFIVAMLVYAAISMETRDRAREIAILKAMGAGNWQIGRIFMFQAFIISLLGAAVGIIMGIIISYSISTISSTVIENSLFYLRVTEYSMLIGVIASIAAGLLGAIWPTYRASHGSVREAMK